MNGPEHYREAERLADMAHHFTYGDGADPVTGAALAAEAQVHATLALAAATALGAQGFGGQNSTDATHWRKAAGNYPAPTPPGRRYKTARCENCGGDLDDSFGEWQHSDSGYVDCGPDGNGPGLAEPVDVQGGGDRG